MACRQISAKPLSEPILLTALLGTNFNETWIKIQQFSVTKTQLKMLFPKWQPFCLNLNELEHDLVHDIAYSTTTMGRNFNSSPQDKMAAILEMAFSNAFSWVKSLVFQFQFHLSLFPRVRLTTSVGSGNGLAPNRGLAITWTNADTVHPCTYTTLGAVGGYD